MIISFFEEFPTRANLSKLKLVKWPTKLYIAAKSLKEFNKIKSSIKNRHVKEVVYWPILSKKEGYWISPFSEMKALLRVLGEVDVPVMIDAELPTTRNPVLYFTQLFNFLSNRKLIRKFVSSHHDVYIAEYYPTGKFKESVMSFLGLHFDLNRFNSKVIKMVYHSMHSFDREFIVQKLKEGRSEFGSRFIVGYGVIAQGVADESMLSVEQLEEDLRIAKAAGLKEVILFRLGGLNKKYCSVLEKFS